MYIYVLLVFVEVVPRSNKSGKKNTCRKFVCAITSLVCIKPAFLRQNTVAGVWVLNLADHIYLPESAIATAV